MNHYPPVWWFRLSYLIPFFCCLKRLLEEDKLNLATFQALQMYIKTSYKFVTAELSPEWLCRHRLKVRLIRRRQPSVNNSLAPQFYYSIPCRLRAIRYPYHALWTTIELTYKSVPKLNDKIETISGVVGTIISLDDKKNEMKVYVEGLKTVHFSGQRSNPVFIYRMPLAEYKYTILENINPERVILTDSFSFDGTISFN